MGLIPCFGQWKINLGIYLSHSYDSILLHVVNENQLIAVRFCLRIRLNDDFFLEKCFVIKTQSNFGTSDSETTVASFASHCRQSIILSCFIDLPRCNKLLFASILNTKESDDIFVGNESALE